ncbi:CHAT domain-containing protein [Saccharothrix sp. S26]|uniref:CHAT domain-containing protein n=1 Tax=Saccharothrix sp. S26 TaxID=2907215 RepID=UPI001F317E23|nr:CHAT domain-containing protein [Saccharothrix sp. S26]MCE6998160.1 CHAT domain-containing protein [Saccharothrix sp. S26]
MDALIEITQSGRDADYRVDLYLGDDGVWPPEPTATQTVPVDLDLGALPAPLVRSATVADAVVGFLHANEESQAFTEVGQHLGRLLLPPGVREHWSRPGVERTFLCLAPGLRRLPWESVRCARALFTQPDHPVVRVHRRVPVDDPVADSLPIRVLVVRGDDDESIGARDEIREIKRVVGGAPGRIEAEFLSRPTESDLNAAYERVKPHVLHFIGHGTRKASTGQVALRIAPRGRDTWLLTPNYIADVLSRPAPRLAILNACRSGETADSVALTDVFLDSGAAAVIGMQGDIRGTAAALFGGELYRALLDNDPVDRAVAKARDAVYQHSGVSDGARDWILPSLTSRVRPDDVLPDLSATGARAVRIEQQFENEVGAFVNRVHERHKLLKGVDPGAGEPLEPLLLVVGESQVGKTRLLNWLRRRCAVRGRRVKYVSFDRPSRVDLLGDRPARFDFLEVLYAIRDVAEDLPNPPEGVASAFDRFNHDVVHLAEGRLPPDPPVPTPEPARWPRMTGGTSHHVAATFESFRACLGRAAQPEPLLLVFDHVGNVLDSAFRQQLYDHLIRHIADGEVRNLSLVVVMTNEQIATHWPERGGGTRVDLDRIEAEEFPALAEDVVLAVGRSIRGPHLQLIEAIGAGVATGKWSPAVLGDLENIVRRMG